MTTMTSDIVSASSWSWVTYTNVIPTSCWSALSSSCIALRSLRSSAPSGSSRSRTVGRFTRARARATRCCWPPDSSQVRRRSRAAEPDELQRLVRPAPLLLLRDLLLAEAVADVLGDVHVREQRVVLEDRVDAAAVRRDAGDRLAGEEDLAGRRLLEAGDHPERRRLAAARRAEQARERAAGDPERHRVDGDHVAEPLRDVEDLDVGARPRSTRSDAVARPPYWGDRRSRRRSRALFSRGDGSSSMVAGVAMLQARRWYGAPSRSVNAPAMRDSNRPLEPSRDGSAGLKLYFIPLASPRPEREDAVPTMPH